MTMPSVEARPDLEQARFRRHGYLVIRGALAEDEVGYYADDLDRLYAQQRDADRLGLADSMHLPSATTTAPAFAALLDHPRTFPLVWSLLGWNIHVYQSHLDVHPPVTAPVPFRWQWHHGGRCQNVEVAYWLSDAARPGRANFILSPGSYRGDLLWPAPTDPIEVSLRPGDAVAFDRRIWRARTKDDSISTRRAAFFGYSHRWIAIRDEVKSAFGTGWYENVSPIRQQLLGGMGWRDGRHQWAHYPQQSPLYGYLQDNGLLDRDNRLSRR